MLTPLTERQETLIINNVVRACKDITALNKTGYNFLYLAQGFIAHYNINGFKGHYNDGTLANDILRNAQHNMWQNFRPGESDYEYYQAKARVYRGICNALDTRPN